MSRAKGITSAMLEAIENRTAVALDGRDAATRIELMLRAKARRGVFDSDEWAVVLDDWFAVKRALLDKVDACRSLRGHPEVLLEDERDGERD